MCLLKTNSHVPLSGEFSFVGENTARELIFSDLFMHLLERQGNTERETWREKESSSISWFNTQMLIMARAGLG